MKLAELKPIEFLPEELARQICQLAAESMEDYFSGSGGLPEDMPECFLVSRVFVGLAGDYCVEMEVTGSEIWRRSWLGKIYWEVNPSDEPQKSEGPGRSTSEYPPMPKEPAGFGSKNRVDLVIKSGDIDKPYASARKMPRFRSSVWLSLRRVTKVASTRKVT